MVTMTHKMPILVPKIALYEPDIPQNTASIARTCFCLGAELEIIDDRILEVGDVSMVAPPAEIHSFTAQTKDTWSVTIVGSPYKMDRHYYDPANNSCRIANPKKQKVV